MFNGIIKTKGKINKIISRTKGCDLYIKSNFKYKPKDIGSSIACDGVCLTLVEFNNNISRFYISKETINRSKFKSIKINDVINMEKPMKYGQDISGHFTQGHVDTIGRVNSIKLLGKSWILQINVKKKFLSQLVEKASVAINGVSLTIAKLNGKYFSISIIPHTLKLTNLINLKKNDLVNIEIDILSKYVNKFFYEKK